MSGVDLGRAASAIATRIESLEFPAGYHAELLGEYAERAAAQGRLTTAAWLALLGIVLVLYTDFRDASLTALVVTSLPFALVGGVLGAVLGGGILSLGSLVGFVTVVGIAGRNGIMLLDHCRHLASVEGMPPGRELIIRSAGERLVPILMTASCASLALLPIALAGDRPGHEIEQPMAMVILGGLATSTAMSLFVLPALYLRVARAHRLDAGYRPVVVSSVPPS